MNTLPLRLLSVLVAVLFVGQALSMASHPNATHVATEVCAADPANNFC